MLVPLHVKSRWSLGLGTASVEALAARAAVQGLPALALTDLENLSGQVAFHHACAERGVRAITGVELRPGFAGRGRPGERQGRLVLLARDRAGYSSLCRIVSRRRAGGEIGGDPVAAVAGEPAGLVALSSDPAALARLRELGLAAGDLRLLVAEPAAAAEAARLGVRPLVDPDVAWLEEADRPLHELQAAIAGGGTMAEARRLGWSEPGDRSFPDAGAAARRFAGLAEAVEETVRLAEECRLDLTARLGVLPSPSLPAGETAAGRLERLCRERLAARRADGRCAGDEYHERLASELAALERRGLSGWLLDVADIVAVAGERRIDVAARGSAVGFLVLHLLGASPVDPVAGGLLAERFLHAGDEIPDIDLDVPSHRRDELLAAVHRRLGPERTAMVAAYVTFQRRSAWREGLRAAGLPPAAVERACRRLPRDEVDEVDPRRAEPDVRRLLPLVERLIGLPRHLSVHPGGIVVGDGPLDRVAPLERAPKGVVVTQFDLRSVAALGLPKIDLLGSRVLSEIRTAIDLLPDDDPRPAARAVRERGLAGIAEDDPETLAALDRADTVGCVQVESPAMRAVLARLPIRSLDDLVAALAIVRPGPAAGQAKGRYIARARGAPAGPGDADLDRLLSRTHGVLLYEEDLMAVLSETGGIDLAEADALRAAIVDAGEDPARLAELEAGFVAGAAARGLDAERARRAWRGVRPFAAYSFSRAHAASAAHLAYRATWMKTHLPLEFGCAVLEHHGGLYPLRTVAAAIVRWDVRLLPPSVQSSGVATGPESGAVRLGLGRVKGLSRRAVAALLSTREAEGPFRHLADLWARVPLSARERAALVRCGACDALAPLSAAAYPFAHEAVLSGTPVPPEPVASSDEEARRLAVYRALVRVQAELEVLEAHVSAHPLEILRGEAERHGCVPLAAAAGRAGARIRVAALVAATRRIASRGGPMRFVTLEDETGLLEAVLFPAAAAALEPRITTPGPYLVEGTVVDEEGAVHLEADRLAPFHERGRGGGME